MLTTSLQPSSKHAQESPARNANRNHVCGRLTWTSIITVFSAFTLFIHGYHPLAEDGGLYIAGVKYTLNPQLYPHDTAFVTAHLRYSVFAPLLASLVHLTHLPLDWIILLAYLASLALTFIAAARLLQQCAPSMAAQLAGMALLAVWWTLPIAGTSLMLMDPYLTARSFSTPLSLLAASFALQDWPSRKLRVARSWPGLLRLELGSATACALTLAFAALFHPLMAVYALGLVVSIRLARLRKPFLSFLLLTIAFMVAATALQTLSPTDSSAAVAAAISRYYWFLSQWHWYELCGLAGPLIIFTLLSRRRSALTPVANDLLRACIFLGGLAVVVAFTFAHQDVRSHLIARLQPLRIFLPLYAIMAMLLGASAGQWLLQRRGTPLWRLTAAALLCMLGATSFLLQRATFPASPHIEFPGREAANTNPWVQSFLWIRAHTPTSAVFALDARYVNQPGEDAQTFRAWAERSALPDFSKDGGEAAITPALANRWQQAATAQRSLSALNDTQRDPRIQPLGATWMVLHSNAPTQHPCPYNNGTVKVCSLIP